MLRDLLTLNVFCFILVFVRVGTALSLLPGFSASYIAMRIRLVFALAVAVVITPTVTPIVPALPGSPLMLFVILLGEVIIGAFFGTIGRILFAALQMAGTVVALVSAMANAFIQDAIAEQQGSILAGFLTIVGLLVIFVSGLHHMMLRAVAESYAIFTPGQPLMIQDFALMVARNLGDAMLLGVQIASPLIVTSLVYYLMLGILGRLMPALPVFFFGLPIQLAIQITVLSLTLTGMMIAFRNHYVDVFGAFIGQ